MAHHKSAIKRIRTNKTSNVKNRHDRSTLRTIVKKVRLAESADVATPALKEAIVMLDKAARKGIIHKNKAARNKSRLIKFVRSMAAQGATA